MHVSALKIHMSKNAHDALEAFPEYVTESRGDILIKVNITCYLRDQFFGSESGPIAIVADNNNFQFHQVTLEF